MIGELDSVEADVRGKTPDERLSFRQGETKPSLAKLSKRRSRRNSRRCGRSPRSPKQFNCSLTTGGAIVPLHDVRVRIGTMLARTLCAVSRGLRRETALFVGSDSGGERAAAVYSMIGAAKLDRVNPRAYLDYVPTHIADDKVSHIDELLPLDMANRLKAALRLQCNRVYLHSSERLMSTIADHGHNPALYRYTNSTTR